MALLDPIYNEEFQTQLIEQLVQQVDVVNSASNGTILFNSEDFFGNYEKNAFFGRIANLIERRDITSDAQDTDKRVNKKENVEVVIDYKTKVFETYENFRRAGQDISVFTSVVAQQFIEELIKRHLNLGVGSAVSAALNNTGMSDNSLTASTLNYNHLLKAQELFEDKYDDVAAYVMNTNAYFDLRRDTLATYKIDNVAGMQIITGMTETMGKPVIVSNIPSLVYDSGSGDLKNRVVALRPGAISMMERSGRLTRVDEVTDQENLGVRWAAEGSVKMGLMGYAWDTANGGASPTDAAIQTGTNWDAIVDNANTGISVVEAENATA